MKLLDKNLPEKAIVKIELKNYKLHTATVIDNLGRLNSFYGPNGSGKTSVLEAIFMVLTAQPWPVDDIHDGAKNAEVSITLNDGHRITRTRTKSSQTTVITLGGEVIFRAAGVKDTEDVIKKISGITEFRPYKGAKPITAQYQRIDETGAFLVGESSPATILRTINAMSPAGALVAAIRQLRKEAAQQTTEQTNRATELTRVETQLDLYNHPLWDQVIKYNTRGENLSKGLETLSEVLTSIRDLPDVPKITDIEVQLTATTKLFNQCSDIKERQKTLADVRVKVQALDRQSTVVEDARRTLEKCQAAVRYEPCARCGRTVFCGGAE